MTESNRIKLVDRLLDVGCEMAQQLEDLDQNLRPTSVPVYRALVDEWNDLHAELMALDYLRCTGLSEDEEDM